MPYRPEEFPTDPVALEERARHLAINCRVTPQAVRSQVRGAWVTMALGHIFFGLSPFAPLLQHRAENWPVAILLAAISWPFLAWADIACYRNGCVRVPATDDYANIVEKVCRFDPPLVGAMLELAGVDAWWKPEAVAEPRARLLQALRPALADLADHPLDSLTSGQQKGLASMITSADVQEDMGIDAVRLLERAGDDVGLRELRQLSELVEPGRHELRQAIADAMITLISRSHVLHAGDDMLRASGNSPGAEFLRPGSLAAHEAPAELLRSRGDSRSSSRT